MDRHTIGKVTSTLLSVAQLLVGAWLVAHGQEWIGAALLLGGGGTAFLPRVMEPRPRRPRRRTPPTLPVLALLLVGCGGWQSVHLPIATALVSAQSESETLIRDARQRDMHEAGLRARGRGGDDDAVIAAVDAAAEAWTCAIEAHRAYSAAVGVYLRELVAALGSEEPPLLARLLSLVAPAVAAYTAIGACVDVELPALPALPGGAS